MISHKYDYPDSFLTSRGTLKKNMRKKINAWRANNSPISESVKYVGDSLTRTADEKVFRTPKGLRWMQNVGKDDWVEVLSVDPSYLASFRESVKARAAKLRGKIYAGNRLTALARQLDIVQQQTMILGQIDLAVRYIKTRSSSSDYDQIESLQSKLVTTRSISEYCDALQGMIRLSNLHSFVIMDLNSKLTRLSTFEWLYNGINDDHSLADRIRSYISMPFNSYEIE